MNEPYFIEVDKSGCSKCGEGRYWCVVGPDGASGSTSYSVEEDADHQADCLNDAYAKGQTAANAELRDVVRALVHVAEHGPYDPSPLDENSPLLAAARDALAKVNE